MAAAGTTSVKYLGILFQEIVTLIYGDNQPSNFRQNIELKSQEQVDNDLERGNDDLFEFIILEISWPDRRRIIKRINYDMAEPGDRVV
jgi:hypothetical protein